MSDQQPNSYLGSNFRDIISEVAIMLAITKWYWRIKPVDKKCIFSDNYFNSAADAEQDLITFLKNYEGFRNG